MNKLQWKVKHNTNFKSEEDFLETILSTYGINEDDLKGFIHPVKKYINDPFLLKNMKDGLKLFHDIIVKDNSKILIRVDVDVDGYSSAAIMYQFIKELNPKVEVEYKLNYNKQHGLSYDDIKDYPKNYFDLIIVPDASMSVKNARMITNNFSSKILVIDHHIIEKEFFNKETNKWITRDEAKVLWHINRDALEIDEYTNYCCAINCNDGQYPNTTLCGGGMVQKFIEGYLKEYSTTEEVNPEVETKFLDLVSLSEIADSMDLRNLESRYYVYEGLKEYSYNNNLLNELIDRKIEDLKWGRYITSLGWVIAPLINGCIRYGKDEEQENMFRAFIGEQEYIKYQPKRKHKNDPKPEEEIHSLQWDVARNLVNIKNRQDSEVRKFTNDLIVKIENEKLDKNTILFVDGSSILTKNTVTGLVANKLANRYLRPVVLLKTKNSTEFGGSMRGFELGNISDAKTFLEECGVQVMGHLNAAGIVLSKEKLPEIIEKCNQKMPLDQLCLIHQVDWQIEASQLKTEYIQEVAEQYKIWCTTVPEPTFAITNLKINASQIQCFGDTGRFIRFQYNGIIFVKKYCQHDEYEEMTCRLRTDIGLNKKDLNLNLICSFQLNSYEGKVYPEVKILYFDSEDITKKENSQEELKVSEEDDWDW